MIDSSVNIVMFHSISDGEGPVLHFTRSVPRAANVFSRVAGSVEVSLRDYARMETRRARASPTLCGLLTFDDGY